MARAIPGFANDADVEIDQAMGAIVRMRVPGEASLDA
jgi:hypothetical protein